MPRVLTHFEIYGEEPHKLAGFYHEMFGWRIERAPGVDYWRIDLGTSEDGIANGGLTYRPMVACRGWVQYVSVTSLDASVAVAQHLGAKVLRAKTAVPKTAWYALLADPQGNVFAIWEPDPKAFPAPQPD